MITLFEHIYTEKRSASSNEIQFTLRLLQQDLKTVLLDISYPTDEKILLLMNNGKVSCIYLVTGDQATRYSPSSMSDLFQGRDRCTIRVCDLTPSSFGAVRTLIEQKDKPNTKTLMTADVSEMIREWQAAPQPSFVHIQWPYAEGFVFIPGNNFSARQYAFLAEDKVSDSAAAVSMLSHWAEPECVISQYINNETLEIWKENNLQLGFSLLLEHVLRRYDDLAGHSLSLKLEDSINRLCHSRSWDIVVRSASVDDVHIFDSTHDAAIAYRTIFELVSRPIGQVIGSRLFHETVDSGLAGLSESLRQSLKSNVLVASLVQA